MDRVAESIEIIREASERFSGMPFVLGFSGGKDSTTALSLLIEAMRAGARISRLYAVYADTLLEHPVLHKETIEALESLKGLPGVEPVVLKPAKGEDYVSMVLDRGYPVPSWYFRWCVDRLKIRPVKRFMGSIGKSVRVLGVRADESVERKRTTMVKGSHPAIVGGENPTLRPIIQWTERDVVEYIKTHVRWDGRPFDYLISLYGYELNDACTPNAFCHQGIGSMKYSVLESETPYTSVRFGCWLCTVVRRNKMPVSEALESARERLRKISDDPANRAFANGRPRKLNEKGKAEIAKVLLEVLEKEPEAFGYDREMLEEKLKKTIETAS